MWRLSHAVVTRRLIASRRVLSVTAATARFSTETAASSVANAGASKLAAAPVGDAKDASKSNAVPMLTIADVLKQRESDDGAGTKTFDDWESIPSSHTIQQAINLMVERSIGALIVTEEKQGVVGIVTERDVLKKLSPRSIASELLRPVNQIMTKQIVATPLTVNVVDALATMVKENIRHLAVVKRDIADSAKKGAVPEEAMRSVVSMRTILKSYAEFLDAQPEEEEPEVEAEEEVAASKHVEGAKTANSSEDKPTEVKAEAKASTAAAAVDTIVTAHSLLKEKGKKIKLILNTRAEDNISVADAVETMARHDFGSVLVVDQDLSLLGIFTERDYMARVLFAKQDPTQIKLTDVSSRNLVSMQSEDTLDDCLAFAAERRCRHYPVVAPPRNGKDNELVGILSIKNLAHEISKGQTSHSGYRLMDYFKKKTEKKEAAPAPVPAASAKKEAAASATAAASSAPTASASTPSSNANAKTTVA